MTKQNIRKLTAAILDRQVETGRYGDISEKRLREAMTTGPDLSEKEHTLLLLSPVARDDWNRVRREILDDLSEQWNEQNIDNELVPLAAAGDLDPAEVSLSGPGFSVTLFRQDDEGLSWVILLQLTASMKDSIYRMTQLRLVDEGGLEWMRGRPDAEGEIATEWEGGGVDLYERARQYRLKLEPV